MRAIGASGTPVKHLAREVKDLNLSLEERNLLSLSYGRIIRKDIESNEGLLPANFERYTVVRPGDVVLRLTDLQNDQRSLRTGLVKEPGIITSAYLTLRPQSTVDSRYFAYALHAVDVAKVFYTLGGGLRQSMGMEEVGGLRLALPQLEEQRRIADYLDDQMSCLDKLMDLCQREIQQVGELEEALLESAFGEYGCTLPGDLTSPIQQLPDAWRVGELGHLLRQLTNGFVGPTREILTEDGVPYIQSLHIKGGRIDFERRPYYVAPEWHHSRPRIHLQTGDVVIVQTGDIGQTAVVPPGFGEASCHALQIARVLPTALDPNYLGEYLRTRYGHNQLLSRATGALHPHLEAGIKSVPVVVPPIPVQQSLVEKCSQQREGLDELRGHIARREQLALEYRQSLITAAVTAEFDVTTARRGIPA